MKRWDDSWWSCMIGMVLMVAGGVSFGVQFLQRWLEGTLSSHNFTIGLMAVAFMFLIAFGIYREYRNGMEIGQKLPKETGQPPKPSEKPAP